jgi:two-component system, sensor histidine kinase RegB
MSESVRSAGSPDAGSSGALPALVRFRWLAIGAQLVAVLVARFGLDLPVALNGLSLVIGLAAISNVALHLLARRPSPAGWAHGDALVGPVLFLDTILLTALLQLSGDASNPFSIVYLVQVTLAAVRATPRWTWAITLGSVLGYGTLFLDAVRRFFVAPPPASEHAHHHHHHAMTAGSEAAFSAHLYGMWLAFAITAVLIALFVSRLAAALQDERDRADRAARLASVSTLAAGAAHELATPLGTIKLAAAELARAVDRGAPVAELKDDARLIRAEVDRMSEVLGRLRHRSGQAEGESPTTFTVSALIAEIGAELGEESARLKLRAAQPSTELTLPRRGVVTAIVNLVKNALDASGEASAVEVDLILEPERFLTRVADRGAGIAPEVQAHLGEPFVTTKEPGRGMGLGLFLVRGLAESLTGTFRLVPREGGGALAELSLPRSVA